MKHKHHIVPKHMGGSDDPSNLIELSVEEHANAHRLLYELHGRWQDKIAWQALSGQIGKEEIILEIIKNANKNREVSEETRQLLRDFNLGRKHSDKTKIKMSEIRKLKPPRVGPHTDETKEKISKSLKGVIPPNKGLKMSEEQKKKISDSLKGTSPPNKGLKMSEEQKKKISNSKLGKKMSEETKKKISNSLKNKGNLNYD
jgi:hypothetical protein